MRFLYNTKYDNYLKIKHVYYIVNKELKRRILFTNIIIFSAQLGTPSIKNNEFLVDKNYFNNVLLFF